MSLCAIERTHVVVGVGSEAARSVRREPTAVIGEARGQRPEVAAVSVEYCAAFGVAELVRSEVVDGCEQTKPSLGSGRDGIDTGIVAGDHIDE